MNLPAWLLTRTSLYVLIGTVGIGSLLVWDRARINRAKREAVTAERIHAIEAERDRQAAVIAATRDSLVEARANTDTVTVTVQAATNSYQRQRATFNPAAPQPPGIPPGSVVVPAAFVAAADSLARLVPQLIATIALERAASERRIAASDSMVVLLTAEVAELKIAVKAARPGLSGRLKDFAIGGVIVGVAVAVLKR